MTNKRGQGLSTNAIVLIILAVIVGNRMILADPNPTFLARSRQTEIYPRGQSVTAVS